MYNTILVSGKARSGKDETAKIIIENLIDYYKIGFADEVKVQWALSQNMPVEDVEAVKEERRKEIIDFSDNKKKSNPNIWIEYLIAKSKNKDIVIPDCRYLNEIELINRNRNNREYNKPLVIRINAERENRLKRTVTGYLSNEEHSSETELDNYPHFDYVIENNGSLFGLKCKVVDFILTLNSIKVVDNNGVGMWKGILR